MATKQRVADEQVFAGTSVRIATFAAPTDSSDPTETTWLEFPTTQVTATATGGAATSNNRLVKVTSEALTTAAGADYVLTLTNSKVAAASQVHASAANGTNTTEGLAVNRIQPSAGSVIIRIRNTAAVALNGTVVISVAVWG